MRKLLIVFILSLPVYVYVQFFTERSESISLAVSYGILFVFYLYILRESENVSAFRIALLFSILYRLVILPGLPNLSDDYFRFIWDGRLMHQNIDVYQQTPGQIMNSNPGLMDADLFAHLNSPDYHSVYPPPLQGLFYLAVSVAPSSVPKGVLFLKLIVFIAELFTLLLLSKIGDLFGFSKSKVLLYALNPLVIIELTGNLHFEGLAIPFLLFAILLYKKERIFSSGLALGLATSVKLLPALFVPLFLSALKFKRGFIWLAGFSIAAGLILFPLLQNFSQGIGSGLNLYFQKFEFNASIYYLVRELGFMIKGYNTIATLGPALAFLGFILILLIAVALYIRKIIIQDALLFSLTGYLLLATTIHPWYVIPLLAISVLTDYRFPLIWSLMIFLTYMGYSETGFKESPLVVFAEYLITFGFAIWELRSNWWKKKIV